MNFIFMLVLVMIVDVLVVLEIINYVKVFLKVVGLI